MTTKPASRTRLLILAVAALAAGLLASSGSAAPNGPNLVTTIAAPSGVAVYQSGRWGVTVRNTGNRDASGVSLTIRLPRTANAPTPYLMGTLGTIHPSCVRSGLTLVCTLGTVRRAGTPTSSKTVFFDITLPYSTSPIVVSADAPLVGDLNPTDNGTSATAALSTLTVPFTAPRTITTTSCTGTAALSSFVECVPGSTQSFTAQLLPGTTPGSGPVAIPGTTYGGTWTTSGTQITIVYTDGTSVRATFVGQGVDADCWEGRTTFPAPSPYVAIYRTCLA